MSHGPVPAATAGDAPPATTTPPANATAAPHSTIACLVRRSRDRTVMANLPSWCVWSGCGAGHRVARLGHAVRHGGAAPEVERERHRCAVVDRGEEGGGQGDVVVGVVRCECGAELL